MTSTGVARYQERHALITGGAGAIGSATAQRMLREGARVTVWDRSADALAVLKSQAVDAERLELDVVDLADPERIRTACAGLIERHGAVDVLVNNVGGAFDRPYSLLQQTDEDWRFTLDLNLLSAVRVTRAFAPAMVERGYGRIVNVGSKAGRYGSFIDGPSYVAAKGALHALTMQIAMEFGPSGVTCNAVAPAMVMIERVRRLWESRRSPDEREAIRRSIPLRRYAQPDDVAAVIAFLGSDDAAFVTGVVVDVNGGQSMQT
ncbi:MAG: SDR family NAD(P)-dependent oxidoreductase [Burkholderiales bacterium]